MKFNPEIVHTKTTATLIKFSCRF